MEVDLHLQIAADCQAAGSPLLGELLITTQVPFPSVQIDIFLSSKESVDIRSLDSNTKRCSDKLLKLQNSISTLSFPFTTLDAGSTCINFKLDLPANLPPSCLIDSNSDLGEISYKLKAAFKSADSTRATCSKSVQITPQLAGVAVLDHRVELRGCCLNYGTVQVVSTSPVPSWKLNATIELALDLDNSDCSVPITHITYELWKKVQLRDAGKHTETSATLVARGLEPLALKPREALLSGGQVAVRIDLGRAQNRVQGHVSALSEHIHVEYSIRFTLLGRTCCGQVRGSFARALMIHS